MLKARYIVLTVIGAASIFAPAQADNLKGTAIVLRTLDKVTTKLDGKGADGDKETLFSGWMFASRPAVSALDHGVYDVWVIDCKVPAPKLELPQELR